MPGKFLDPLDTLFSIIWQCDHCPDVRTLETLHTTYFKLNIYTVQFKQVSVSVTRDILHTSLSHTQYTEMANTGHRTQDT